MWVGSSKANGEAAAFVIVVWGQGGLCAIKMPTATKILGFVPFEMCVVTENGSACLMAFTVQWMFSNNKQ